MDQSAAVPEIEPEIVAWAAARPGVSALLITSTRAVPGAPRDALSDYDIILVVDDAAPYAADRAWVADFGEVLVAYWDPPAPGPAGRIDRASNVVQYASGLKIDFTVWETAELRRLGEAPEPDPELDAGFRVLLDRDGLAARLPPPTAGAYVPRPPDEAAFQLWVNDFLSDAPYVAKCLWRGEVLPARWCLDYDMKLVYLLRVLEWRAGVASGWSEPVGSLGKGMRRQLAPETWAAVERSFAWGTAEEGWDALWATMDVFRGVAREVAAALGYAYPEELHRRVADFAARVRATPRG